MSAKSLKITLIGPVVLTFIAELLFINIDTQRFSAGD